MSALARIDELGGRYYDKGICRNAIEIVKDYGANLIRLRLFNDPFTEDGREYGGGICNLEYLKRNIDYCKRYSLDYLLDFHYSDFWADPGKQTMPKAWVNKNIDELEKLVYEFTIDTLKKLDLKPKIVQIGNEITNGMLWPVGHVSNFSNLVRLVNSGIRAVRDFDSSIKIMIHLDDGTNSRMYSTWFDSYFRLGGMDFDYIGMSHYLIWNDSLSALIRNISDVYNTYGKEVIIAETSYPFSRDDYRENIPEEERKRMASKKELMDKLEYGVSKEAQCAFYKDLLQMIKETEGLVGFIYWGGELIPKNGSSWSSYEGIEYTKEKGPIGNEWANQAVFDYDGNSLPVLEVIKEA